MYIGYCVAENNPGDPAILNNHSGNGIIVGAGLRKCLIEYCEAMNNGWDMPRGGNGPAGIWGYQVDSLTIQYCIAHDNKTSPNGGDGDGFDLDGGARNCVIQYCYAYNNLGPGYLLCQYEGASAWTNNTIRYCISQNDGTKNGQAGILFWGRGLTSAYLYNNVVYNQLNYAFELHDPCPGCKLWNNIFVTKGPTIFGNSSGYDFRANCYWKIGGGFLCEGYTNFTAWASAKNQELTNGTIAGINQDPLLKNAGMNTLTDPAKLKTFVDYQLQPNSPCLNRGLDLKRWFAIDPGPHGFYGNRIPVDGNCDLGVQ